MLLLAGTPALGAGLGNNPALAPALGAGSNISKATEDTLLNTLHLPCTIAVRAAAGLAAWLTAGALALRAVLGA